MKGMHGAIAQNFDAGRPSGRSVNASSNAPQRSAADALVVAIARHQDRDAFAALFQHFAPRVKSYLIRLGVSPAQADELAQEALVVVWRKAALFDPSQASAATWIFRIARNLRIDALRRDRRAAAYEPDPSDAPEPPPTPDVHRAQRQRDERVRAAVASLGADQLRVRRR